MSDVPLAGSLISIVTKNELRYEGVLESLDATNSTILLTSVRALGTEGRPRKGGLPAVAVSAHVFPSICFKGADIAEIRVLSAAAAPAPAAAAAPKPAVLTEPLLAPRPAASAATSVFERPLGGSKDLGVLTVSGVAPSDTAADIRALFPTLQGAITAVKMQGRTCDVILSDRGLAEDAARSFAHPRFAVKLMEPGRQPRRAPNAAGAGAAAAQQQHRGLPPPRKPGTCPRAPPTRRLPLPLPALSRLRRGPRIFRLRLISRRPMPNFKKQSPRLPRNRSKAHRRRRRRPRARAGSSTRFPTARRSAQPPRTLARS